MFPEFPQPASIPDASIIDRRLAATQRGERVTLDAQLRHEHPTNDRWASLSLHEWAGWSASKRLDFISEIQEDTGLSRALVSFLREVVQDKSLDALTRNNAANALVIQDERDPDLAEMFRAMLEDPTEDEQWRDYALQFLAASADWSANLSVITAAMWRVAGDGSGSIVGTALLHLHYLDERGRAPVPIGYRECLARRLDDPSTDVATSVTLVGIIRERRIHELKPALRLLVQKTSHPAIRRVALAAIGRIGEQSDQDLIALFLDDADALTAASARGAVQNLASQPLIDVPSESRIDKP